MRVTGVRDLCKGSPCLANEMRGGDLPCLPGIAGWMEPPVACSYWETCSFLVCALPIHTICRFLADEITAQNGLGTSVHKAT